MLNIEIIPAVMPESFDDVGTKSALVAGLVETVQLDIMDGIFVPEKTWPYTRSGLDEFRGLIADKTGLPNSDTMRYEVDLMITEPEQAVLYWLEAGAARVIVHIESTERFGALIETIRAAFRQQEIIENRKPIELGVAIDIDTPTEAILPFCHAVDFVQCMGIAHIGYQGQPFDARVIPKIRDLRNTHPNLIISVDGGVNFESAPQLVAAGINRLVSGSAIFTSDNPRDAIARLRSGR